MILIYRSGRFRYERDGCSTGSQSCPFHPHSVTVTPLDRQGRDKPGGTVCLPRDKCQEET